MKKVMYKKVMYHNSLTTVLGWGKPGVTVHLIFHDEVIEVDVIEFRNNMKLITNQIRLTMDNINVNKLINK